jgi:hypothetical protein
MQIKLSRVSALTVLVSAIGIMCAFSASASADSITCEVSGSIKLSPGLSETPTVQNVGITSHKGAKLANCKGSETTVTGGTIHVVAKTKEAVSCKTLKESGAALESANDAQFKWAPKGEPMSTGSLNVPITEMETSLSGSVNMGSFPFSEDTITGSVTEKYSGTCGSSSGKGHGGKKVNKGQFSGTITIS